VFPTEALEIIVRRVTNDIGDGHLAKPVVGKPDNRDFTHSR
jgi:hypothetical protein